MPKNSGAARKSVQRHRAKMRRAGFRLIQMWVPDTRSPEFAAECRRQARNVRKHMKAEEEVMDWIERVADTDGWTA